MKLPKVKEKTSFFQKTIHSWNALSMCIQKQKPLKKRKYFLPWENVISTKFNEIG